MVFFAQIFSTKQKDNEIYRKKHQKNPNYIVQIEFTFVKSIFVHNTSRLIRFDRMSRLLYSCLKNDFFHRKKKNYRDEQRCTHHGTWCCW